MVEIVVKKAGGVGNARERKTLWFQSWRLHHLHNWIGRTRTCMVAENMSARNLYSVYSARSIVMDRSAVYANVGDSLNSLVLRCLSLLCCLGSPGRILTQSSNR